MDLWADHRLEPRRAVAECKATVEPIGGDAMNKFVGVLDAERGGERKHPITGYFISLAGFTGAAIEQERQLRLHIVTLNGTQVVNELVKGRILIAKEQATELAGRCSSAHVHLILDTMAELLAHELGWIWAVYYTQGKPRTHFALIHSDGTPLALALAASVIAADRECGGRLHNLFCLNSAPSPNPDSKQRFADALAADRQYIANESGLSEPEKANKGTKAVPKKHVFLSYCRDNQTEVTKLYGELVAAGEAVWWDQDILPGQDWKFEIRKAMRNAYAVVLCLSLETAARITSGIYSEALDAIGTYREYSPGNTFLIPVRLSDCEIPPIEIDGTRTLDRLQFVDLFPPVLRAAGLARLIAALQAAPLHP